MAPTAVVGTATLHFFASSSSFDDAWISVYDNGVQVGDQLDLYGDNTDAYVDVPAGPGHNISYEIWIDPDGYDSGEVTMGTLTNGNTYDIEYW
jgi:hypothetical protein